MKKYKLAEGVIYNNETFIITLTDNNELEIVNIGEAMLLVLIQMHHGISYQELEKQYILSYKSLKGKAAAKEKKTSEQMKFADALKNLMNLGIVEETEKNMSRTPEISSKIQKIQRENALLLFSLPVSGIVFLIIAIQYHLWLEFALAISIAAVMFILLLKEYKRFQKGEVIAATAICDGKRKQAFSFSSSCICEFTSDEGESFEINLATNLTDYKIRRGKRYILFFKATKDGELTMSQENFLKIK